MFLVPFVVDLNKTMNDRPAFIRRVCQAKAAELTGDMAAAIAHLDVAAQLACEPDDRMQLAAWRKRLETSPAPAKRRAAKIRTGK